MHPEEIKAALRMAGITPAMLADELQVAPSSISQTISGYIRSARIQLRISQILRKPVAVIWPNKPVTLKRTRAQIEEQRRLARRATA